jgi:hypothetical protein
MQFDYDGVEKCSDEVTQLVIQLVWDNEYRWNPAVVKWRNEDGILVVYWTDAEGYPVEISTGVEAVVVGGVLKLKKEKS